MEETPLSLICQSYAVHDEQALQCAKLLIRHGAVVNTTNRDGLTPLQTLTGVTFNTELGDQFVKLLLDAGANWRITDGKGATPLDWY